MRERINALLQQQLSPQVLHVEDESWKHAGHAGANPEGGSHFHIHIESEAFANCSTLAKHRMVNAVLAPLFEQGVHAIRIDASAPSAG